MRSKKIVKCSVKGCNRIHMAKGLCSLHWQRINDRNPINPNIKRKQTEYIIWTNIKSRCHNPNNPAYKNYGGRGIKMCSKWVHDYDYFLFCVGNRPSTRHSLDRIDNKGDYEPGNVKWSTWNEQQSNKRSNNSTCGVCFAKSYSKKGTWISTLMVNGKYLLREYFDNELDAIEARKKAERLYLK
jgi:hypothetical protein